MHAAVASVVVKHGARGRVFRPLLEDLFEKLRRDPKQFPTKTGALAKCRAAPVRFNRTSVWRCVFRVDEAERVVRVLALGPHDAAYKDAERRD